MRSSKIFFVTIFILSSYFLFRLIDQSQMITVFPIDNHANDYSGHIVKLFFLEQYGYHQQVPNWYNGAYTLLSFYPPLWYLMTYPIYKLTHDTELTGYLSLLLLYLFGFIFIYLFGKEVKLSRLKRVLFSLFFFVNPIAIGYFLRLGKLPEMLGWVWVFLIAFIVFHYKERKLDKGIYWLVPLYTLLLYTHILVFVVATLFLLMLFFSRKHRQERFMLFFCGILILLTTAYFWFPFLQSSHQNLTPSYLPLQWLIQAGNLTDKIVAFILPALFWILFFLYWKSKDKKKEELIFFLVPLVFSFLYFTRIAVFLPFFNRPAPDSYHFFFIFLMCYFFLSLDFEKFKQKTKNILLYGLLCIICFGILLSILFTPFFEPHSPEIKETFALFPYVEGRLMLVGVPTTVNRPAAYSYGAIYYNISTPAGWEALNVSLAYQDSLSNPKRALDAKDCTQLRESLARLKTTNIISFVPYCSFIESCNFTLIKKKERACLYMQDL